MHLTTFQVVCLLYKYLEPLAFIAYFKQLEDLLTSNVDNTRFLASLYQYIHGLRVYQFHSLSLEKASVSDCITSRTQTHMHVHVCIVTINNTAVYMWAAVKESAECALFA